MLGKPKAAQEFIYVRHPKYPEHGQLALIRGKNGNTRRIGAIFNEFRNPMTQGRNPPSSLQFTVEFHFPQVMGRGADNIVKCGSEAQAKLELMKRFNDFLEDVVTHREGS